MTERDSVVIGHTGVLSLQRGQSGHGDRASWSLPVRFADDGLVAEMSIWLGPDGVEESLADFFAGLAQDWRGWTGARQWVGTEGGLTFTGTHDGQGHIQVAVSLRHLSGAGWAPPQLSTRASLMV